MAQKRPRKAERTADELWASAGRQFGYALTELAKAMNAKPGVARNTFYGSAGRYLHQAYRFVAMAERKDQAKRT